MRGLANNATEASSNPTVPAGLGGDRGPSGEDLARGLSETLREAVQRHGENAVLLCSFQKEESVLIDELLRVRRCDDCVRIVTIDTGVLFPGDAADVEGVRAALRHHVEVQDATGPNGPWTRPRELLLGREGRGAGAARWQGAEGWITGIRREQGTDAGLGRADRTRRGARHLEVQPAGALDRQGPVAAHLRARPPLQPAARPGLLLDRLRAVHAAWHGREGRWAGTEKTECGLHIGVS